MTEPLTIAEAAAHTGRPLMTVYGAVRRGHLPAAKVNGRWWIRPEALRAWTPILSHADRGRRGGQHPKTRRQH